METFDVNPPDAYGEDPSCEECVYYTAWPHLSFWDRTRPKGVRYDGICANDEETGGSCGCDTDHAPLCANFTARGRFE